MEVDKKEYGKYVEQITPKHSLPLDMAKAFLVGGAVCTAGQLLLNAFLAAGLEKEAASAWTLLSLIGASVLLTGLNIYQRLVKFGGAGALVPITGFANSVAAPAIEYRADERVIIRTSQKHLQRVSGCAGLAHLYVLRRGTCRWRVP